MRLSLVGSLRRLLAGCVLLWLRLRPLARLLSCLLLLLGVTRSPMRSRPLLRLGSLELLRLLSAEALGLRASR